MLEIAVFDKNLNCIAKNSGDKQVHLLIDREYQAGDRIILNTSYSQFLKLKLEPCIDTTVVYSIGGRFEFIIPFGEKRMPYPYGAFEGRYHILNVFKLEPSEIKEDRDISTNPLDIRGITTIYPHCLASVETRDESIFAARNTIDGYKETCGHGIWPYTSWGDNEDDKAEIWIEFGRKVIVSQVIINLRADFPHDNYWKQLDIVFGDFEKMTVKLKKTGANQCFSVNEVITDRVKLCGLIKDETDPSPFPALTHWQVFGREILE